MENTPIVSMVRKSRDLALSAARKAVDTAGRPRAARALAEALFPPGEIVPAPDPGDLLSLVSFYTDRIPGAREFTAGGLALVDALSMAATRRPFSDNTFRTRRGLIEKWNKNPVLTHVLSAAAAPFKLAWLGSPEILSAVGVARGVTMPKVVETGRWRSQMTDAADCGEDLDMEADVAVLGTGAGGAAAAHELASRGHAVALIEEGRYFSRKDFSGNVVQMTDRLYRNKGATFAFSPWPVFLPLGKAVGGTTTVNSGTCFPPTPWVYEHWRSLGLPELNEAALSPHLAEVARLLKISTATDETIGPVGEIIRSGAAKLGLKDVHALSRNAEACDGKALCQFGCPSGAKQSTDVSVVPRALERGAFLFTGFAARRLLWENGSVAGVVCRGRDTSGAPRTLTVRAKNVVVAMGTLLTPVFLARNGVEHPQLGRNLTFHPASGVGGIFPGVDMKNQASIPQGIGIRDFAEEGLMLEGGTMQWVPYGMSIRRSGKRFVHLMENWPHTAFFGFMVRDRGRGRVWTQTPGNFPLVTYRLDDRDFGQLIRAMGLMMRLFLTQGASEVFSLGSPGLPPVRSLPELDRFMRQKFRKRDFFLSAWHPLGTARVAPTPEAGVCGPDHQVWGRKGLYVMDGSAVPGPLGVNPQVTIAALSLRAASLLADRLDREAG